MKNRRSISFMIILLFLFLLISRSVSGASQGIPEFTDGKDNCFECSEVEAENMDPFSQEEPLCEESITMEELSELDEETAGAAMEEAVQHAFSGRLYSLSDVPWSFDAYYVNQQSPYHVTKTDDFHLKYQYDFHTDIDLEKNSVEIRFPNVLLQDRYGTGLVPTDIGVPFGIPEEGEYTAVSNSPFNYYIEGTDLVFFNYREIRSGTNTAVQVLYKNLKILDLADHSEWKIVPRISVFTQGVLTQKSGEALTGVIDTEAVLTNTSKSAVKELNLNYTPGLYTKKQVMNYIGTLPTEYEEHFSDYAYVLWKVKNIGHATQPWELYIKDTPTFQPPNPDAPGNIVGMQVHILNESGTILYKKNPELITAGPFEGYYKAADYFSDFINRKDIQAVTYIVAAYPKASVVENTTIFRNDAECVLYPTDGADEKQIAYASADWTWVDYHWSYSGNIIGIEKEAAMQQYPGWLDTYAQAVQENSDLGDFSFRAKEEARIYGFTHQTEGNSIGEYVNGSYCEITTADDVLYVYPQTGSNTGEKIQLDDRDYYFSKISVQLQDKGYDIFEDKLTEPEAITFEIDRGMTIYAMFADSDQWEAAGYIPWDSSGSLNFAFSDEQLARQPWRVKVIHNSVDYQSECQLHITVKIRSNSPVFAAMYGSDCSEEEKADLIRLENLCAVTGRAFLSDNPTGVYFQDQSTDGVLYQEENLIPTTKALYGTIAMRDCSLVNLTALERHAQAQKYANAFHDPEHERIRIQYTASAFESYHIYSKDALAYLKKKKLPVPGRKDVVFYDLLPYGVQLDPSKPITAGQLTGLSEVSLSKPTSWNSSAVRVWVDSDTDIIQDFRNTGRTLIKFHVSYRAENPSVYASGFWMSGYGISFSAYCSWDDIRLAEEAPNICAYMPESGDLTPILGTAEETACDDGVIIPAFHTEDYSYFGIDINEDGITNIRNILYCRAIAFEDLAVASESGIKKTVRADKDRFGIFNTSAVVGTGDSYTYDITVTNTSRQPLRDMVIFDRLEHAAIERKDDPSVTFEDIWWYGTLKKLHLSMLKEIGINPVVYYHGDRTTALIPEGDTKPDCILTEENGWYTASAWTEGLEQVQAVAVDLSFRKDGTPFCLENMESVSLQIQMTAPEKNENTHFAYNNASFSSLTSGLTEDENIRQTVHGNSVSVGIEDRRILKITKELMGETPSSKKNEEFLFTVSTKNNENKTIPYASREYTLYKKEENEWKKQNDLRSTDSSGRFWLKPEERAVFREEAGVSILEVSEEKNPFWIQTVHENLTENSRELTFSNEYRPVLYVRKKVSAYPEDMDLSKEKFYLQLLCNGVPAVNQEYWYVDRAAFGGSVPKRIDAGRTDSKGIFAIYPGEMLALFPGHLSDTYEVLELSDSYGSGTNWYGEKISAKGTLSLNGNLETLENIYNWKDLYLTKKISNQNPEECTAEFSFCIQDLSNGTFLRHVEWELLDLKKNSLNPEISGVSGEDGIIRCACAGRILHIKNMEAGKTYGIQEVDISEAYQPENNGYTEVTMPIYSRSAQAEITNEYLFRNLKVSKLLLPDSAQTSTEAYQVPFEMTLLLKEETEDFAPKTDFPYQVWKNGTVIREEQTDPEGHFYISGTETAEFKELGMEGTEYRILETPSKEYPPVYPAAGTPAEGIFRKKDEQVLMINGRPGCLVIRKEYVAAEGDTVAEELLQTENMMNNFAFSSNFYVELDEGNGFQYPSRNVLIVYNDTGQVSMRSFSRNYPISISGNQTAVIPNIPDNIGFRITEQSIYQHRTLKYGNNFLAFQQVLPENDGSVVGVTGKDFAAIITNEVRFFEASHRIYKRMTADSVSDFTDGSNLVLRVEKYNGTNWRPAAGIRYFFIDAKENCSICHTTGKDGMLSLVVSEKAIPSVVFQQKVYVNPGTDWKEGMLRVVELPELSDEVFGIPVGYSSSQYYNLRNDQVPPNFDVPPELADTFVNSNTLKAVEIEKQLSKGNPGQSFVMEIQNAGGTAYAGNGSSAYLPYAIYNTLTKEKISDGKTTAAGEFYLKAGQFARFWLCDGSAWIITEKYPYPYNLDTVSGNDAHIEIRSDKSAAIYLYSNMISSLLTKEMLDWGIYDPTTGKRISLTEDRVVVPKQVLYGDKLVNLLGVDNKAFQAGSMKEVILPEGMTSIGAYAFYNCPYLTNVQLPNSIHTMGTYAFANSPNLEYMKLPENLLNLPPYAFYNCQSLREILFPTEFQKIGSYAFYNCAALKEISIPYGITTLDSFSFANCSALEEITFPNSVTAIGDFVFRNCTGLTEVSFPDRITSIGSSAFEDCCKLNKVYIPDSVIELKNSAFLRCTSLEEIHLSENLTQLNFSVLAECHHLKKLIIPSGISVISQSAFSESGRLTGIYIDKPKDSISNAPWGARCPVYWNDQAPSNYISIGYWNIEDELFYYQDVAIGYYIMGCKDNQIKRAVIPDFVNGKPVLGIMNYVFCCNDNLEEVYIPDTVTKFGQYCFFGCTSLKELTLPEKTKSIGFRAFACTGIRQLVVPSGVSDIGAYAFYACRQLETVFLQDGLQNLNTYMFKDCTALKEIHLSNTLTTIPERMFEGCSSLKKIEIPDSVTLIDLYAFLNCTALTDFNFPPNMNTTGNHAFEGCTGLKSIYIPDTITIISGYSFASCSNLEDVRMSQNLTAIYSYAFQACSKLKNIQIPEGVTTIFSYTFDGCTSLEQIQLPETITVLEKYAFSASGLKQITIPASVTQIASYCFSVCRNLEKIIIQKKNYSLTGSPWDAPNSALVIKWTG